MEVKQEPVDPLIEEYKIDIDSIKSEFITECWNYENIELSRAVKNEFFSIKKENETDLRIDNVQETYIEDQNETQQIIDDADMKCNSIQLSDIKQSKEGLALDGKSINEKNHFFNQKNLVRTKMNKKNENIKSQVTYRGVSIDADVKDGIEICDHELKEESDKIGEHAKSLKNIDDSKLCSNEMVISDRVCCCSKNYNNPEKCEICVRNRVCQINGKSLESECCLNKHLRTHTDEKTDICSSFFTQKSHLNRNFSNCSREKRFKCIVCSKKFFQKGHLNVHLRVHTGEKPFKCNFCEKSFLDKGHLNKHLRIHTGEKPFKCNICTKSFSENGNLKCHLRIHTGVKSFKCNICTKSFFLENSLKYHLRTHSDENPLKCNLCTKSFSRKHHLNQHFRIHTGEKPFECNVCMKSFSQKGDLNKHLRIHTGEKSFNCSVCAKSFPRKDHFKDHLRTHNGGKPFKCNICMKSFSQKTHLNRHLHIHTGEEPFNSDNSQLI